MHHEQSVGPAPHSLAPMAMSSQHASSTGTNRAMSMSQSGASLVLREKPSLKWGVMIALTGALLGGVLGLGMDARRQSARAAAAQEARDAAPASPVAAAALPVAVAAPVGASLANAIVAPAPVAPGAVTPAVAPPPPVAAVVIPPSAGVVVTSAKGDAKPKVKPIFRFSAKVNRPAPEPKEAPEAKPERAAKPEAPAPEAKPERVVTKPSPKGASTSEAQKVLEAANKDTVNTL